MRLFLLSLLILSACSPGPKTLGPGDASWKATGEDMTARFGFRAGSAGDVNGDGFSDIVVASPGFDKNRGRIYAWYGGSQGLAAPATWVATGSDAGGQFGDRAGAAGDLNGDGFDDVFAVAPTWNGGMGRAYVYCGGPRGLSIEPCWEKSPQKRGEQFGDCTVYTGDLNGDGFDDLAVGAFGFDGGRGKVYVFMGSKQGLGKEAAWTGEGEARDDQYGYGMGAAGDVNGDGFDDLLIASKLNDEAGQDAGKAFLYLGSAKGLSGAAWSMLGEGPNSILGLRSYGAGDVNADGFNDIILGSPGLSGTAQVFHSSAQGPSKVPAWRMDGSALKLWHLGFSLGPAGDLDGDAISDVLLYGSEARRGVATAYLGSAQGLKSSPAWRVSGGEAGENFAAWTAPAGDVNADGYADVLLAADAELKNGKQGAVYLYLSPLRTKSDLAKKNPEAAKAYFSGKSVKP